MNELLKKYENEFGEQFPLMLFRGVDEKKIEKIIKECLEKGKPYEPKLEDGIYY